MADAVAVNGHQNAEIEEDDFHADTLEVGIDSLRANVSYACNATLYCFYSSFVTVLPRRCDFCNVEN